MKYSNLKKSPNFVQKTIKLIENAFEYDKNNSFHIDFYPLMKPENHKNNYILIDGDEVIAHIGALSRQIKLGNNLYSFTMFGGIAVSEKYRGQGLFKKHFSHVLEKFNGQAFYLLWSEKLDLYEKFNFYPCGKLNEYESSAQDTSYKESSLSSLSTKNLKQLYKLYESTQEIRPLRSQEEWNDLSKMTSIQLYIKQNDQDEIENYFLKNKGKDLTNIIHEYGIIDSKISSYGKLWSPEELQLNSIKLNAFLLHPGENFINFMNDYCHIEIKEINENVEFKFNKEEFQISIKEFLPGVFGPGRFQELQSPYIFIPGAISI